MLKNEFSIDQQEDEDLRCPICNYYFSEITKPFLLPCNHNLCLKCIDCIIEKKMLNCPICRKFFKEDDKNKFQVNFAFLNLVIKILKTKVIFCKKCSKIYNWVDHYNQCDQRDFIETNEMIEQIKKLADESFLILKSIDKHKNVLSKSKQNIFESTHDILKIINLKFYENYQKTIESFFSNVPILNYKTLVRELKKFLELCRPLDPKLNSIMNELNINVMASEEENSDLEISDEDFDMRKRTKSQQKGKKGAFAHFNINVIKQTPNLSNSVNKLPMNSVKKNKVLNYSSYLDENIVKDKIRNMLSTSSNNINYRSSGKIMNLSNSNNLSRNNLNNFNVNNIYHHLSEIKSPSADIMDRIEKNHLLRKLSKKSLPIEEDEDEDNISIYCDMYNKKRVNLGKNLTRDDACDKETIKIDYMNHTKNTNNTQNVISSVIRKNVRTHSSNEEINYLNDNEADYINLDSQIEDENYCSIGPDANYNIELSENFVGSRNTSHIPNFTKIIKNKVSLSANNLNNYSNINTISNFDASPIKPIINVPNHMDQQLNLNNDGIFSPGGRNFFANVNESLNNLRFPTSNTNIMNLNYNFNVNQIFNANNKDDYSDNIVEKGKSTAKKKIIVKNNEVKIVNVNNNKKSAIHDSSVILDKPPINDKKALSRSFIENQNILTDISRSADNNKNTRNLSANKFSKKPPMNNRIEIFTPHNPHDSINKILAEYNNIKEIVDKILTYTKQIELTSETIQNQISTNFSHLQDSIVKNINSLCDNITVQFSNPKKQFLIFYLENTKRISVIDVTKMKPDTKEFDFLKFKFNNSISIDYDDNDLIFISGGRVYSSSLFESDYTFTNNFLILRWSNRTVELSGQMPRKRAFHSSIFYEGKLYVIGGLSTTVPGNNPNSHTNQVVNLKECECYNWNDKRWELMPSMNSARCNASLCVYNRSYLYAFRGWVNSNANDCNFLDTIEFININNISSGWTMFKPEDPGLCWKASSNSIATVIGENKILICGGIYNIASNGNSGSSSGANAENKFMNFCYIFDPVRKSVYRGMDLIKASSFNNVGTVYENSLILVDNKNETSKQYGLHVYDIENNIWKFNQI